MADSFAHLHVHTEYSMLDGAARHKDLFAEVARLGMPAVAATDHGNLHGAYSFYQQAKVADVKPIIGVEAYKTPGTHRGDKRRVRWGSGGEADVGGGGMYTHMTILAENAQGLRNLMTLSSRASLEGQVRAGHQWVSRVDEELLQEYREGLIVTTGCMGGEVHTWLRLGQFDKACESAGRLMEIFGRDQVFLEIMDHGIADERRVRPDLLRLGAKLGLRPLATNDSHYVTADQTDMHDAFLCIQTGKKVEEPDRFRFDGEGYHIKSPAEMRSLWDSEVPGACDNTLLVAERVTTYDEVFAPRRLMPVFPVPDGYTPDTFLVERAHEGLNRRRRGNPPESDLTQLNFELGVISDMGFPSYFLIVEDFIAWAKGQGVRVGPGRGSAAGSLVAYALGITDLDPIPHGLLFERFLNPARVTMPDIDIDFDERRRGEVIEYVARRWGREFVAAIGTFGMIKAKAAIKDSVRVLGLPPGLGDKMTKLMPKPVAGRDAPLAVVYDKEHSRYAEAEQLRELLGVNADARRAMELARQVEGYTRQTGVHAAGVIISPEPLAGIVPLHMRHSDKAVITQWPQGPCEDLGLLKMDLLGLRNLTIVEDALANIEANRGVRPELALEDFDDPATYALLARGDTLGVFQLDSPSIRGLLRAMRPTEFGDISAVLALYRPGPMGVNAHMAYADRKNGRKPADPLHAELADALAPILAETYNVIVYQEQVIKIAQAVAGYSAAEADLLRRAMGKKKKEVLDQEFARFRAGMKANNYSDEAIQTLWDTLASFADYAFNKSHSAAYGVISYWTAFLKVNFPAEYMAALLTSVGDNADRRALYLAECRRMGIRVLSPDINASQGQFTAVGGDIRFGLDAIKDVGTGVVEAIVRSRAERGDSSSFADWLAKVDGAACKASTVAALIKAGAFDSLGHPRRGLLEVHADAVDAVAKGKKVEATGQFGLFDLVTEGAGELGAVAVQVPNREWGKTERLVREREVLGLYVSGHPLEGLEDVLREGGPNAIVDLAAAAVIDEETGEPVDSEYADDQHVQVAGLIASFEQKVSAKSKPYAVMTLEDRDGAAITVLFFARALDAIGDLVSKLRADVVVAVKGKLRLEGGEAKIFADDVKILDSGADGEEVSMVTLVINAEELDRERVDALKDLTRVHPGPSLLLLRMRCADENKESLYLLPERVRPSVAFTLDAKKKFGEDCLAA